MRNKRRRAQQKAKLDLPWVGAVGENQGLELTSDIHVMSEVAAVQLTNTCTLQMTDCAPPQVPVLQD